MRDWQHVILRAAGVRTPSGTSRTVFALSGDSEPRVNVAAQQQRALNIVAALLTTRDEEEPLVPKDRYGLIVVGAGVGGWTAAVAAAVNGIRVLLIDEHAEPLTTQRVARHRYLHPNLYDWPVPGWWAGTPGVGFANWKDGPAHLVRRRILAAGLIDLQHLNKLKKDPSARVKKEPSRAGDEASPRGDAAAAKAREEALFAERMLGGSLEFLALHRALAINTDKTRKDGTRDDDPTVTVGDLRRLVDPKALDPAPQEIRARWVITATGFLPEEHHRVPAKEPSGLETKDAHLLSNSYWRGPAISEVRTKRWSPSGTPAPRKVVVIAGDGDGALNDVVQLALCVPSEGSGAFPDLENLKDLAGDATILAAGRDDACKAFCEGSPEHNVADLIKARDTMFRKLRDLEAVQRDRPQESTLEALQSPEYGALDDLIESLIKPDVDLRIVIRAMRPVLKPSSYLVNRFLVARLAMLTGKRTEGISVRFEPVRERFDLPQLAIDAPDADVVSRFGPRPRPAAATLARMGLQVDPQAAYGREGGEAPGTAWAGAGSPGIVNDMLDMTRHAWWRPLAGSDRPNLTRIFHVLEGEHDKLDETLAELKSKDLAFARELPGATHETWPMDHRLHADRVVELLRAVAHTAKPGEEIDSPSYAIKPIPKGLQDVEVELDAAACLLDTTPTVVAVTVAQAACGNLTLIQHDGVLWVRLQKAKQDRATWIGSDEIHAVLNQPEALERATSLKHRRRRHGYLAHPPEPELEPDS